MSDRSAVVVGGGGFVGKSICYALKAIGYRVISVGRGEYPELVKDGIQVVRRDIASVESSDLSKIFDGATAVFHTAADVSMWGPYEKFYRTNVLGTRSVIDACRLSHVKALIFTSSPSVVACGQNLCGVDESTEYPPKYNAYYPQTKSMAEREVLAANSEKLSTIALRPHLIFGPGDNHFEPLIVKRAKQGRLVRIGKGDNIVSLCHIDDCTSAHVAALNGCLQNPSTRGKMFFVKSGDVNLWNWIDAVLVRNGLKPIKRSVPVGPAIVLGSIFETISKYSGYRIEPPFTRFLVEEMATHHYFNIQSIKSHLGWEPKHIDLFDW